MGLSFQDDYPQVSDYHGERAKFADDVLEGLSERSLPQVGDTVDRIADTASGLVL